MEPVKFTRRTAVAAISRSTTCGASAGALVITLTTPAGKPACSNTVPISRCRPGHNSDALRITVLPQASGMAIARVTVMSALAATSLASALAISGRRLSNWLGWVPIVALICNRS